MYLVVRNYTSVHIFYVVLKRREFLHIKQLKAQLRQLSRRIFPAVAGNPTSPRLWRTS
jgi:hypothetical protein